MRDLQVKAFLIPTTSGSTAQMIARYRPSQPIVAISPNRQTVKALCLVWGVSPLQIRAFNPDPTKTDHPVGRQGYTWHGSQPNGWWFLNFTQGEFLIHPVPTVLDRERIAFSL